MITGIYFCKLKTGHEICQNKSLANTDEFTLVDEKQDLQLTWPTPEDN